LGAYICMFTLYCYLCYDKWFVPLMFALMFFCHF
jgi:hypothetical protein